MWSLGVFRERKRIREFHESSSDRDSCYVRVVPSRLLLRRGPTSIANITGKSIIDIPDTRHSNCTPHVRYNSSIQPHRVARNQRISASYDAGL